MEEVKEIKRGICPLLKEDCRGDDCEWDLHNEDGDHYCAVGVLALALANKGNSGEES